MPLYKNQALSSTGTDIIFIMVWTARCFVLICLVQLVVSDGYTKDKPSTPFQEGGDAKENTITESTGTAEEATGGSVGSLTYGLSGLGYYGFPVSTDYVSRYYGPVAVPVVLPDGTLAYTPEVAAARAAHLAALERAKALWYGKMDVGSYDIYKYGDYKYHGASVTPGHSSVVPWHGPLATVTVLPSGYLADTPAIAPARAAHLQALLQARQEADKWRVQAWKQWD